MKIKNVDEYEILFDNGMRITYSHYADCCEWNYADFKQLEELALDVDFVENLVFEEVESGGFRFGSAGTHMFFIPCYSEQNGYYSSDLDILFNNELVFNIDCPYPTD